MAETGNGTLEGYKPKSVKECKRIIHNRYLFGDIKQAIEKNHKKVN